MRKVFISYSHRQGDWVWNQLKPCLEAGGAEVLIDVERFKAGTDLSKNMDRTQDKADCHVLAISDAYLASKACQHEMKRAIARDPNFERSLVIPVVLEDCTLPAKIKKPLYVDLRNPTDGAAWERLMGACGADLGCPPPEWLRARDETARWLGRGNSVDLVVGHGVRWRELIDDIRARLVTDYRSSIWSAARRPRALDC